MTPKEYLIKKGYSPAAIVCNDWNRLNSKFDLEEMLEDYHQEKLKLLGIAEVITRLPIGTIVAINDTEDHGKDRGTIKKITGYCSYLGKHTGYLLDGEGIYLLEDFKANDS